MRDMMNNQRSRNAARWGEKVWLVLCLLAVTWALTVQNAQAQQSPFFPALNAFWDQYDIDNFNPVVDPKLALTQRVKAAIDECWDGTFAVNALSIPFAPGSGLQIPEDILEAACIPVPAPNPPVTNPIQQQVLGVPNKKANQTYIWSMASEGNKIIYGTAANVFCSTSGGSLGATNPSASTSTGIVCEYGTSHLAESLGGNVPDQLGDWRPPRAYVYNAATQELTDKTQSIIDGGCEDELNDTIGFRAAGAHNGWSFLAGSSLRGSTLTANASEQLYMFAWNPNGDFAGCHTDKQHNDGRKMQVVKDALYFGVQNTPDSCPDQTTYTIGVKGGKATVKFKTGGDNSFLWGYQTANGAFQPVSTGSSVDKIFTTTTNVTFVLKDKATNMTLPLGEPIESLYTHNGQKLIWSLGWKAPNGKIVTVSIPSPDRSGGDYFAAVANNNNSNGSLGNLLGCGGSILRWTGYNASNPFDWTVVGRTDAMVANIAGHDGRLFAITWPQLATLAGDGGMTPQMSSLSEGGGVGGALQLDGPVDLSQLVEPFLGIIRAVLTSPHLELGLFASLYMSPTIPPGGLTSQHKEQWRKVWQSTQYDPDIIVALTYGGGDLRSFDGYLWWGTMHLPGLAEILARTLHDIGIIDHDTDGDGQITNVSGSQDENAVIGLGTQRFTSIHRGKNFGTHSQAVQVVYGDEYLPIYDRPAKSYTFVADAAHKNKTGQPPLFGLSGFGYSSFYTWIMEVFDGSLYMGTFAIGSNTNSSNVVVNPLGADLWRIDSKTLPAVAENLAVGDAGQYGVRSTALVPNKFYLGMAGPVNLDRTHLQALNPGFTIPKPGYQLLEGTLLP